ncbi:hypothetical protein [Paenibacillus campi]|uniref:hypothetical protein n=1 Tax=Paenibacillus campi TaxID=3106031 RepID=UPI002AFFB9CF|nr:hypothetical protein [Paenibacillus sp. SGZ-1014]
MTTPIPRRNNVGSPASEVKTYKLTPAEIAALTAPQPIPASHTKPITHRPTRRQQQSGAEGSKQTKAAQAAAEIEWFAPERREPTATIGFARDGLVVSSSTLAQIKANVGDRVNVGLSKSGLLIHVTPDGVLKLARGRARGAQINNKQLRQWIDNHKIKKQHYPVSWYAPGEALIKVEYDE